MKSIRRKVGEVLRRRRVKLPYDRATLDDLYYCYRLILKREPDPVGWDFFKKENADQPVQSRAAG